MKSLIFDDSQVLSKLFDLQHKKITLSLKVIKYLFFDGPKSVADICRKLKVSSPNGNMILNNLIEKEIIVKSGYGKSRGGRKPELYSLNSDAFHILSVDMNMYQTRLAIYNSSHERVSNVFTFDLKLDNQPDTLIRLVEEIKLFIAKNYDDPSILAGVGVSLPGLVNYEKGINETYLNFGEKPLKSILEDELKKPVFIENDAKAITLAAWRFGVAKGKKNVLVLLLDWGVGLGLILDGKLYRGADGFAGEFSHIPLEENGELCICGKLGCLQTVAAGTAVVKNAIDGLKNGKSSLLTNDVKSVDDITLDSVVKATNDGDQFAIQLFSQVGKKIGKGISILMQLFNPEMIVLGGKMAETGQYLTTPVQQAVNVYAMSGLSDNVRFEMSLMGDEIGLKGGIAVVAEELFDRMSKEGLFVS
ncbi:ROK family protein [Marinilabiliaceae bacterium ANBcel2]|nr:ROK family protein [Marinilabiliaceae bacterium ANBcel2]